MMGGTILLINNDIFPRVTSNLSTKWHCEYRVLNIIFNGILEQDKGYATSRLKLLRLFYHRGSSQRLISVYRKCKTTLVLKISSESCWKNANQIMISKSKGKFNFLHIRFCYSTVKLTCKVSFICIFNSLPSKDHSCATKPSVSQRATICFTDSHKSDLHVTQHVFFSFFLFVQHCVVFKCAYK